nr:DinB family protein [Nocardioides agariphilus]
MWEQSGRRLRQRCEGMTDEEFFWEPVADCWNIRPDGQHPGAWTYEYEFAPADPVPMTTIGWRLVHLNAGNRIYWNHAFGDGTLAFPDLEVPHTAESALAAWRESRLAITLWLTEATEADLAEPRPSHLPERQMSAGDQVRTLVDEQIHHAAEIALLRDLFARPHQDHHTERVLHPPGSSAT